MDVKKYFIRYKHYCISYCICFLIYVLLFFIGNPYTSTLKVIILFVAFIIAALAMKLTLSKKLKKLFYIWFLSALACGILAILEVLR